MPCIHHVYTPQDLTKFPGITAGRRGARGKLPRYILLTILSV